VTVLAGPFAFEVTTFRQEGEYTRHRRPQRVSFIGDIRADLARRDFTINAMAMDIEGRLIDPFGGRDDLRQKTLRTVGDPFARFQEDALRLMRCLRFAAAYQLTIEQATWQALLENRPHLRHVAMERVRTELEKMIEGPHPYTAVRLLAESRLSEYTKKNAGFSVRQWTAVENARAVLDIQSLADSDLKWTALFLLISFSSAAAEQSLRALTFSGRRMRSVVMPLKFHEWFSWRRPVRPQITEGTVRFGEDAVKRWLGLLRHCQQRQLPPFSADVTAAAELLANGEQWLAEMPVRSLKQLDIHGGDLIRAFKRSQGPWVGALLQRLLLDAAANRVKNERNELLKQAEKYAGESDVNP
jgi:tRNA nucleotidyltransferase (CCA-adding enzyme)